MTDGDPPVDLAALDAAWDNSWRGCPPAGHRLRRRFPGRWGRFHTLPQAKRYATSDAEQAEILHRHRTLLTALGAGTLRGDGTLVAITCSWSATSQPTPLDVAVVNVMPEAMHWRSDDLATETASTPGSTTTPRRRTSTTRPSTGCSCSWPTT